MEIQPQSRRFSLWMWVGRGVLGIGHRQTSLLCLEYLRSIRVLQGREQMGRSWARSGPFADSGHFSHWITRNSKSHQGPLGKTRKHFRVLPGFLPPQEPMLLKRFKKHCLAQG